MGQPATRLTITSPVNQLTLYLDAIPERFLLAGDETIFSMGSAAGQLTWKERVIPGRVIYEYLVKKNFNLMTRCSLKGLGEFQGLYPAFGHGCRSLRPAFPYEADGSGDASPAWFLGAWQTVRAPRPASFRGPEACTRLWNLPLAHHVAHPLAGNKGLAEASVTLSTRKLLGNWVLAGFSMGIVSGKLSYDGQQIPLYGLAELFMM